MFARLLAWHGAPAYTTGVTDYTSCMGLSPNALAVLERRYLVRDESGHVIETPDAMFRRVARAVARAEERHGGDQAHWEKRFFERMQRLEFLPNSPTLMNAGRPLGQLAACFVLPVGDSIDDIFSAVQWTAHIQQSGGGTGFAFSRLRPAGDVVYSTMGKASGPLAFMDVFNAATDAIKQGGTRRGANMGVLAVDHPDILEFITSKLTPTRLTNFNISVAVTDAFMTALENGADYDLVNPRTGETVRSLSAARVFDAMAGIAWRTGDPGVIFIDRINATQPTPDVGAIESTNPCGEQPLLPFESCVLGSLNLERFFDGQNAVDMARLGEAVDDAVRFLDDVIDENRYPLEAIATITRRNRKIGLGVMGLADLLVRMKVPYDSERALEMADQVWSFIEKRSREASARLATERGAFEGFEHSRWASRGSPPLRNATTTTVAPTGTISIIAGCSSGIEPLFALAYERNVMEGTRLTEAHGLFRAVAEERGFWTEDLSRELAHRGSARGLSAVPDDVQALFPTAYDIAPEAHVKMQAVFQRHAHAGVSKTVNFAVDATAEDVARVYRLAYQEGCKGVTVYRDGSRAGQVLSIGASARPAAANEATPSCPECDGRLEVTGGCEVCRSCGFSLCVV